MKQKLLLFFTAMLMMGISSCSEKHTFTIKGLIKNPEGIKKVYLLTADSTGLKVVDSTNFSENGEFQFKEDTPYANLYKLRIGSAIFDLIAENGDAIGFRTDLKDLGHQTDITGSQATVKLKEWDQINDFYAGKSRKIYDQYEAELQQSGKNQDSLLKIYTLAYQKNATDFVDKTWKFALENKNSLAGFYAAASLDQRKYEAQLVTYAADIKNNFQGHPAVQRFVAQMEAIKLVATGQKAPEFTATSLTGKQVKLSDFKGQYLMIDFWASWCPLCRKENPNIVKLYHRYHGKGFQLLGVSLDTENETWQEAVTADKLEWTQVSDFNRFDGHAEKLYHIEEIPSNFIIDPQGKIIARNLFGADLEDFLTKVFILYKKQKNHYISVTS